MKLLSRAKLAFLLIAFAVFASGCSSSRPYTLGALKTEDPDREPIPEPREIEQNFYWDRVDLTVFHQLKKPLNLAWTGRKAGALVGIGDGETQADNVNAFDEPPRSSWWTPRHYYRPMTAEELAIGPNTDGRTEAGPDTSGTWTIWRGKSVGAASGFFIQDARGVRYLLKFDKPSYPELASSAEVISTKILHAAGYHVPENTIAHVHPEQIEIGEGATVQDGNDRRPMRPDDVTSVLEGQPRRDDGKVRVMASRFVDGHVLGPWNFRGRRDDDPNDRVRHQDRRELRGLRVISAWLNDTDRRAANTLAVYTDERYIKHYVQDMSSTLGANTGSPHRPIHGQAYMIDHRLIPQALVSFGLFRFPWWEYDPSAAFPSVGYWRSDVFRPDEWVPTYPNPAFEKLTRRDAFWGSKIVTAFSDDDLAAIVQTAEMSNPEAEAYLLRVLQERRDKTGRYWFRRIAPLDRFRVSQDSGSALRLAFDDLAVERGMEMADAVAYRYTIRHDGTKLDHGMVSERSVGLRVGEKTINEWLDEQNLTNPDHRVVRVDLAPEYRSGDDVLRPSEVQVFVYLPATPTRPLDVASVFSRDDIDPHAPRVVGLRRK
ncbi:hypothetical protein [Longibacter salinarum]|nr:hypothetical protein [Longibacter salinarum]